MNVKVIIEIDKQKVSLLREELVAVLKNKSNTETYCLMQLYEQLQLLM